MNLVRSPHPTNIWIRVTDKGLALCEDACGQPGRPG
jgi:hypothetical protein